MSGLKIKKGQVTTPSLKQNMMRNKYIFLLALANILTTTECIFHMQYNKIHF